MIHTNGPIGARELKFIDYKGKQNKERKMQLQFHFLAENLLSGQAIAVRLGARHVALFFLKRKLLQEDSIKALVSNMLATDLVEPRAMAILNGAKVVVYLTIHA